MFRPKFNGIADQFDGGFRRAHKGLWAINSFNMSFWIVPPMALQGSPSVPP